MHAKPDYHTSILHFHNVFCRVLLQPASRQEESYGTDNFEYAVGAHVEDEPHTVVLQAQQPQASTAHEEEPQQWYVDTI